VPARRSLVFAVLFFLACSLISLVQLEYTLAYIMSDTSKKSCIPPSTKEMRSGCSIQSSCAESINEQIAMLTSHINSLKNKQKLIAESLNNQSLKTTMAEVVSQALSSEVGPLVEASVKKLTPSHEPDALMPTV